MKISYTIFFVVLLLVMGSWACKDKEEDKNNWISCYSCSIDSWTGIFEGTTSYFDADTVNVVEDLDITIEFEETASDYLTAYINVPNYFSTAISGEWNSPYSISFAGSNSSLVATLHEKDGDLRLAGNAKKFHFKVDSLIVDEVISFEVYKRTQ